MGERSTSRIKAGHVQAMIEGKITNLMPALKDAPVATVEKALTAEAVWPGAEFPNAEAKTAAGTEAASNVETFSESKGADSTSNLKITYTNRHYGKYRKNNFFNPRHSSIRWEHVDE